VSPADKIKEIKQSLQNGHRPVLDRIYANSNKILVALVLALLTWIYNREMEIRREERIADHKFIEVVAERARLNELAITRHIEADAQAKADIKRRLDHLEESSARQWQAINGRRNKDASR